MLKEIAGVVAPNGGWWVPVVGNEALLVEGAAIILAGDSTLFARGIVYERLAAGLQLRVLQVQPDVNPPRFTALGPSLREFGGGLRAIDNVYVWAPAYYARAPYVGWAGTIKAAFDTWGSSLIGWRFRFIGGNIGTNRGRQATVVAPGDGRPSNVLNWLADSRGSYAVAIYAGHPSWLNATIRLTAALETEPSASAKLSVANDVYADWEDNGNDFDVRVHRDGKQSYRCQLCRGVSAYAFDMATEADAWQSSHTECKKIKSLPPSVLPSLPRPFLAGSKDFADLIEAQRRRGSGYRGATKAQLTGAAEMALRAERGDVALRHFNTPIVFDHPHALGVADGKRIMGPSTADDAPRRGPPQNGVETDYDVIERLARDA